MSFTLDVVSALSSEDIGRLCGAGEVPCGSEWTCRALVQMLPPLEQQYVLRLAVAGDDGVAAGIVERWTVRAAAARHMECLERLRRLRVLTEDGTGASAVVRLRPEFGAKVRAALCSTSREPWRPPVAGEAALKPDKKRPSLAQLQQWMVWRWNTVLLYIVGEPLDEAEVVGFVRDAGLMTPNEETGEVEISSEGLDFLLKARHEQLWLLVQQYVASRAEDRADLVAFILTLAYCTPGEDYPVEALCPAQRRALKVLGALGLVFQRNLNSARFYPTQLGVDVAFGFGAAQPPPTASSSSSSRGSRTSTDRTQFRADDVQVIVQTNFQILAYTDATAATAKLVMAMLALFATLKVRLPNLIVGAITRDAVKSCVSRGIKVKQIIDFLESHAHPLARAKVSEGKPAIPDNVVDQMTLWAGEEKRIAFKRGCLVTLRTDRLFEVAMRTAGGKCAWHDRAKRRLFVDPDLEPKLRTLLR